MKRFLAASFAVGAMLLSAGCAAEDKVSSYKIQGRVVNCWTDRGVLDVETSSGIVKHLVVSEGLPGCLVFSHGGEWLFHYRKYYHNYSDPTLNHMTTTIDWIQKVK
jgi:hypothetical protein